MYKYIRTYVWLNGNNRQKWGKLQNYSSARNQNSKPHPRFFLPSFFEQGR